MGLVVQAPLDALLPAVDPLAAPAATPAADDGLFASLLATLAAHPAAGETAQDIPLPLTAETTGLPAAPARADDEAKRDALADLFANTVPLPLVSLAPNLPAPGTSVGGGGAAEPSAEAVGVDLAPGTVPLLPVEGDQVAPDAEDTQAAPPADVHPTEAPAVELAAPSSAPAVFTPEVLAEQPGALEVAQPPAESDPPAAAEANGEAPSAPPAEANLESVVRPVGNAETNTEAQPGLANPERKPGSDRPVPRASERAIERAAANSAAGALRAEAPADAGTPAPAPAPDPAAAAFAPETAPQVEHIARTVIETVETGGGEARIHLDPVDLGEVTIHVHTDGAEVRVDVRAERPEAMQLLRDHTHDLSALLGDRGLNLSDVNVGLGRGNGGQPFAEHQQGRERPLAGEFAAIFGTPEAPSLERHHRLRAAYNPDGAHIYRV